jgi:hypothetical protein
MVIVITDLLSSAIRVVMHKVQRSAAALHNTVQHYSWIVDNADTSQGARPTELIAWGEQMHNADATVS